VPNLILENEIPLMKLPFKPEVPHFNGFISSTFTDIGKPSKKLHDYAVTRTVNKYVRRYPELEEFTPLSRYLEPRREFAVDPHTVMPRRVIQEFIVTRVQSRSINGLGTNPYSIPDGKPVPAKMT
jgi:hypothetical protein